MVDMSLIQVFFREHA